MLLQWTLGVHSLLNINPHRYMCNILLQTILLLRFIAKKYGRSPYPFRMMMIIIIISPSQSTAGRRPQHDRTICWLFCHAGVFEPILPHWLMVYWQNPHVGRFGFLKCFPSLSCKGCLPPSGQGGPWSTSG